MRKFVFVMAVSFLWTADASAASKKPVVGIADIKTAAQNISCRGWRSSQGRDCNYYLAEGFRVMLETAIVKSNKMDVMERNEIGAVLQEQGLGQMNLTTSGGRVGGLTGIDYLIYGSITQFGARKSGFSIGGGHGVTSLLSGPARGVFGGGGGTSSVHTVMAVDLKVTDVATGQIILADTVEGGAKTGEAMSFAGITTTSDAGDPFANVQRLVAAKLAEAVVTLRIPFKIIKIGTDGALFINYGNAFLRAGDLLAMYDVGESIVDPDTGEELGAETTETGLVQVTSVQPKFSKAKLLSGTPTVGAVLQRSQNAPQQQAGKRKKSGAGFFSGAQPPDTQEELHTP